MRTWMSGLETDDMQIFDINRGGLGIVTATAAGIVVPYGQYVLNGPSYFNGAGCIATFRNPDQSVNAVNEIFYRQRIWSTGVQDYIWLKSPGDVIQVILTQIAGNWLQAQIGNSRTVVGTASTNPITSGFGHLIEAHVLVAASGGRFEVKVDGAQVINFTGNTKGDAGSTLMDRFSLVHGGNNYGDDYAFNDATGAENNSWIGEGGIGAKYLNGPGDVTTLNGAVGSGTHWQNADEVPPNDADYNYDDSAPGTNHYDLYALSSLSNVGTVNAICTRARAMKDAAGIGNFRFVHKTHSAEYRDSADIPLLTSMYPYPQIREVNPNTGVAWTAAELAALQVGYDGR